MLEKAVSTVKENHTTTCSALLAEHIKKDSVQLVMEYVPLIGWGQQSTSEINALMCQQDSPKKQKSLSPTS